MQGNSRFLDRLRGKHVRKQAGRAICFLIALIVAVVFCLPFVYMLLCSFQPASADIFQWPPRLIPETFRFQNYADAFETMHFLRAFGNTVLLVVSVMTLNIVGSVLVAYGFARFEARLKSKLFGLLLSTMMLPWVITMIPSFAIYRYIGWIGTRLPLIVPAIGGSAFNIFMLRQFMLGIPRDLDEAATIDGCSSFGVLWRILLPNMLPVLATLVVFQFTSVWSDYVGPSIYLTDKSLFTLALSIGQFSGSTTSTEKQLQMAGCTLYTLPLLVLLFSAQKVFMKGIVTTSVKE